MNLFDTSRRIVTISFFALTGIGALAAALPQTAGAQTGGAKPPTAPGAPGGMDPAMRAKMAAAHKKMIAEYHITPDQESKLNKMQMEWQTKAKAVYFNKSLTDAQKKTQMMELAKNRMTAINAILTPEQRAMFKAKQQQMMQQRMKQMQAGGTAPGMPKGAPTSKPAH